MLYFLFLDQDVKPQPVAKEHVQIYIGAYFCYKFQVYAKLFSTFDSLSWIMCQLACTSVPKHYGIPASELRSSSLFFFAYIMFF